MAWRIESHVVRGEIDNRTRGRVVGRFWFVGRASPVEVELQGDACRDLAGRHLVFTNPHPQPGLPDSFAARQIGVAGEITASRKRKVPDIPIEQVGEYYAQERKFPWHWGNCVYFEWFSATNGPVVIESPDYQLTISPESTWDMTAAEEQALPERRSEATQAFMRSLGFLSPGGGTPHEDQDWTESDGSGEWEEDEDEPLSEEEADRMMADSDRLTDRLLARLDEADGEADIEAIIEEELERRRSEADKRPLTPDEEAERNAWLAEINRAADELSTDPELLEELEQTHPLAERAKELSLQLMTFGDNGRWVPKNSGAEHPALDLIHAVMKAGGKLAGALDAREWPPALDDCALCISWLKRARGYLEDALSSGDFCAQQNLIPAAELGPVLQEVQALHREVGALIEDLRERLARGFD